MVRVGGEGGGGGGGEEVEEEEEEEERERERERERGRLLCTKKFLYVDRVSLLPFYTDQYSDHFRLQLCYNKKNVLIE